MLRASARAVCPSCCSACAAPTLLLTPAQHRHPQLQISPEHCLLERPRWVHLYWKCQYKIDYESKESKSVVPYLSRTLIILQSIWQAVSQVRSVHAIRTSKHGNKAEMLPGVSCCAMLPQRPYQTCRPLPGNASSGHLRPSNQDCQKQRHS